MAKYHVSTDGNPRVCSASEGKCPFGGNENHYTSKEAARAAFEESTEALGATSKKTSSGESVRMVNWKGVVKWISSNGEVHRDGDLPAVEWPDGQKEWYRNGLLHRDGGQPAVELSHGTKLWYQNDELHRDGDLPAIEYVNGTKKWYRNGQPHRDGNQPAVEWSDGTKEWWVNGWFLRRVSADGTDSDRITPYRGT